jgi:hypothetical protein
MIYLLKPLLDIYINIYYRKKKYKHNIYNYNYNYNCNYNYISLYINKIPYLSIYLSNLIYLSILLHKINYKTIDICRFPDRCSFAAGSRSFRPRAWPPSCGLWVRRPRRWWHGPGRWAKWCWRPGDDIGLRFIL